MLFEAIHFTMKNIYLSWLYVRIINKDNIPWFGLPDLGLEKPIGKDFEVWLLLQIAHHVADLYLRIIRVIH